MPNGYIVYQGPSEIDGEPIVVVALTGKSRNTKTGAMLQTYIMRSDIKPTLANKTGEDYSICGNCIHRGKPTNDPKRKTARERSCYVVLGQGPTIVWKGLVNGVYPYQTSLEGIASIGEGRKVRLGTYGDPAAVPSFVWKALLSRAVGHTGYSHQADMARADYQPSMTMTSVDTLEAAKQAWISKRRTFRVIDSVDQLAKGEILCPASKEAGQRTTCLDCGLCAGSKVKAKSIAIVAHGTGSAHFAQNVQ